VHMLIWQLLSIAKTLTTLKALKVRNNGRSKEMG
jgi:hypothetical protein